MTVAEILEKQQPQIYNFLIDLFDLDMRKTTRIEPEEFAEDDYMFRYYKDIMTERKGVKQ